MVCFLQIGSFGFKWCSLMDRRGQDCFYFYFIFYYELFGLSFWRHPFTSVDQFVSNATFLQIWWRNKLLYILDDLKMSKLSANCHFCVIYSFKVDLNSVFYFRKTSVFSLEVVKLLWRNRNKYQSGSLLLSTGTLHPTASRTDLHSFDLTMLQSQH